MDKCRLCLKNSKNLRSVFDKDGDVVYIDMITSISNTKIRRNDKFTHLCLQCRRKLIEAFQFKNMIEMSNLILSEDTNIKRINFNNLDEIEIKVKIERRTISPENNYFTEALENCLKDDTEFFWFNNTVIKRVENCADEDKMDIYDVKPEPESEPNDDDFDQDYNNYESCVNKDKDDEYLPNRPEKKYKYKHKASKKNKKDGTVNVLIKPVFLKDVGIVRTKQQQKMKIKKRVPKPQISKKQMCNFCGIMTSAMKSHILVHTGEKTHKCDICEKAFYTEQNLKKHKRMHDDEKKYSCDKCIAKFWHPAILKRHMLVHTDEKRFVCHICNKPFKRKNALRRHVIYHNSANKTIKCDLCNMTFFSNCGLKHHMRVHTGERPYRCEMCSQGYSYKHDFNRHCFKKHGVFLKRRKVHIMNEEVLVKERELMRLLMLRLQGVIQKEDPLKEFEVPQGYKALEQAINLIESKQLPVDANF